MQKLDDIESRLAVLLSLMFPGLPDKVMFFDVGDTHYRVMVETGQLAEVDLEQISTPVLKLHASSDGTTPVQWNRYILYGFLFMLEKHVGISVGDCAMRLLDDNMRTVSIYEEALRGATPATELVIPFPYVLKHFYKHLPELQHYEPLSEQHHYEPQQHYVRYKPYRETGDHSPLGDILFIPTDDTEASKLKRRLLHRTDGKRFKLADYDGETVWVRVR